MTGNSGKWKNFERLVTAIHKAADAGAEVRWNETIAGRQFDVTIRFRKGLYEYLTVVECKNRAKPVSVGVRRGSGMHIDLRRDSGSGRGTPFPARFRNSENMGARGDRGSGRARPARASLLLGAEPGGLGWP